MTCRAGRAPATLAAARLAVALAALLPWTSSPAAGSEISGRVVHGTRPEAAAGVTVQLLGIGPGGEAIERSIEADAEGRFRFEGLGPGGYFVAGLFGGLVFPGGSARFEAGAADRIESMTFQINDRGGDPKELRLAALRWILEREAGVYRLSQLLVVRNPSSFVVTAPPEGPAPVRVALADGHGEVEAPFGRLPPGVEVRDGFVELRGPFFPGDREYTLAYDVRDAAEALETGLELPAGVELAELLVRDFGVRVELEGLHPARPVRQGDELYLRWIGFAREKPSPIPVRLTPLPPREPLPAPVRALFVALLAGAILFWVARPLASPAVVRAPAPAGAEGEREAVLAALRDLEHDFETGKLSAADHERLERELRREALRTLARAREATTPQGREAPAQRHSAATTTQPPAASAPEARAQRGEAERSHRTGARSEPQASGVLGRAQPARSERPASGALGQACLCGRPIQSGDRFCAACGRTL